MNYRHIFTIFIGLLLLSILPRWVRGQTNSEQITVTEADTRQSLQMISQPILDNIFAQVSPNIIKAGADATYTLNLTLNTTLNETAQIVSPRITAQGADAVNQFIAKSLTLPNIPGQTTGRIVVTGADSRQKFSVSPPGFPIPPTPEPTFTAEATTTPEATQIPISTPISTIEPPINAPQPTAIPSNTPEIIASTNGVEEDAPISTPTISSTNENGTNGFLNSLSLICGIFASLAGVVGAVIGVLTYLRTRGK